MLQPRSLRFGWSSNTCNIYMISLIKVTRSYSRWIEVTSSVKWSSILPEGLTSVPSTDSDVVEHGDRLTCIMTCTVDQFEVDEQMSLIKRVLCLTIISLLTPQSHEDCYQNGKQIMWYLIIKQRMIMFETSMWCYLYNHDHIEIKKWLKHWRK